MRIRRPVDLTSYHQVFFATRVPFFGECADTRGDEDGNELLVTADTPFLKTFWEGLVWEPSDDLW